MTFHTPPPIESERPAAKRQSLYVPEPVSVADETLRAIAARHGIVSTTYTRLPDVGIFNTIYLLGNDIILRIPRDHPKFVAATRKEARVVPLARIAGVRTPVLLAFDDTLDLLPVPYALYERVHGETLGLLDLEPEETPQVWRELGHDLALLHTHIPLAAAEAAVGDRSTPPQRDPRALVEPLASDGYFTSSEARWLLRLLDRLAPTALAPTALRLIHGDSQATNVMVTSDTHRFLAVLDWGSSDWGDVAYDFAGVPLRADPFMLEGYRAVAPLEHDATAEARIFWRHLLYALENVRREPQPLRSWAERPLTMLIEIAHFCIETCDPRWRALLLDAD